MTSNGNTCLTAQWHLQLVVNSAAMWKKTFLVFRVTLISTDCDLPSCISQHISPPGLARTVRLPEGEEKQRCGE
ncbi:hypothetical protein EYF80_022975 [Liparis tanakae]|uniref:Uncharacterized protein n=1 Tax=Liparis tanakae TaxID=230148 RepID=A0A4Z2HP18_9TELE|nr:hypothetical protein EYF80_022975 [Liparis tanakae]